MPTRGRGDNTGARVGTLREERADGDGEAGGRLFHVYCFSFPRAQRTCWVAINRRESYEEFRLED